MAKSRLETIEEEMEIIKNLRCMSYNTKMQILEEYQHEHDCILLYHSPNPIYEED